LITDDFSLSLFPFVCFGFLGASKENNDDEGGVITKNEQEKDRLVAVKLTKGILEYSNTF